MSKNKEVPKGWEVVSLKEVSAINPRLPYENIEDDLEVSFLPMKNVEEVSNIIHLEERRKYSEVKKGYTPMADGDVIFAKITPCMENGKIAIVHSLKNGIAFGSTEFHVIRPNQVVLNSFLFYFLVQERTRQTSAQNMTGAVGQRRVPKQFLETYNLPLPPLPEQHRIVAKIEELFTNLDKGIESLKTAQQQLKIYRQAVLKWAFEGKLTNKNVTEGELPEGWKCVKLADLIDDIKAGKSFKCDERPPSKDKVGILKVSAISWGVFDEMESKTVTDNDKINFDYLVEPGDFILSRANTLELVGAVVIVKSISKRLLLSDKTLKITFSPFLSDQYALYYLRSKNGRKQIQGYSSGNQESMRNIGQAGIKNIEVPLPKNIEEQQQIVAEIESRLSVCDKIEESISQSLQQAEALRQSILKKAFEGTLVPQDPNDEPAWVLLERTRAEREVQPTKVKKPKAAKKEKKVKKMKAEKVFEVGEQLKLL